MQMRDLLDEPRFGLVARAGRAHLDREIRWVHATELLDPSRYLNGGELIHTVGLWRRSAADSETFARALHASSVSGVALGVGAGPMLATAPPDLVEACERHALPLLEVPDHTPFVAISQLVIEAIMDERRASAERSLAREQRLVRASGGDGGVGGLIRVLADELDGDCWVLGPGAAVVAGTAHPPSPEQALALVLAGRRASGRLARVPDVLATPVTVAPIRPGTSTSLPPLGHLVCAPRAGDLELQGEEAVAQAIEILELELGHRRVVEASERRLAWQLFEPVVSGRVPDDEATRHLSAFGLADAAALVAVVAAPRTRGAGPDDAIEVIQHVAGAVAGGALMALHEDEALAVLTPEGPADDLHDRLLAVGRRAIGALGAGVAVGVSELVPGGAELRRAVIEARQARRFAELRREGPAIARGREIGSHALLLALNEPDVRSAFRASLLGPLERYDAAHRSELVRTLAGFLETCGAWQRTADELHVHVNTLRYRIGRIEALTGRDLATMDDRVDFHLALRLDG